MTGTARGTLFQRLLSNHGVDRTPEPGREIALEIDQTLTQDATGTLVMLELEAIGLDRVRTRRSAQYVDHNLVQADERNPDDHLFLDSACRRWGIAYHPPGEGVSHVVHMQRFGVPGATLLGSDSHTCAAGSLAMLAIGAGGLDVALAMAGRPFRFPMPEVWGIELTGRLPDWVGAKDVILELLRRHGVRGGVGRALEYHGPGVETLSAMERHVIANMGAELGATTSVFPSDARTREFLAREGREADWTALAPEDDARYDRTETVDLSALEPLIARPSSPGNVVPVREVEGEPIYQAYLGSSANPGYRDFAVPALMVRGRRVADGVSFDVNPASRRDLERLARAGYLADLIAAGGRLHQAGCNGCIGMGQAPATGRNSLRTTPRNFPGRSGAREDSVFLCSPQTATASALAGAIRDPRRMDRDPPRPDPPSPVEAGSLSSAPPAADATVELVKGPNIESLPELDPVPDDLDVPVLLSVGDDVSTDEILPAGTRVLPYRSNLSRLREFAFVDVDPEYVSRAGEVRDEGGHAIVAGHNYGQGSSREHAALAVRDLGLRVVLARNFARIHRHNLINFGVVPLVLPEDAGPVGRGDRIVLRGIRRALGDGDPVTVRIDGGDDRSFEASAALSEHEREVLLAGGMLAWWTSGGEGAA